MPAISLDICPEEHMASLALELPKQSPSIEYASRAVTPKTDIPEAQKTFLTCALARVLNTYKREVIRFGTEWSPDSFPFRELAFALVSIASDQAEFHYFPTNSKFVDVEAARRTGWLDKELAGDKAPLPLFGSLSHLPGDPPGVSPMETMYWLKDVLISLTLVIDGEAIAKAVTWGLEQGRVNFQIVILTLFEVGFAEVSLGRDDKLFVTRSKNLCLSPLREKDCVSSHPRDRPEPKSSVDKPSMDEYHRSYVLAYSFTMTMRALQHHFPGLAALVNFFDAAAIRRTASRSTGVFPLELYDQILSFVDFDTWKTCSVVSAGIRSCCLRKYRVSDQMRIVRGPFVRLSSQNHRSLSFDFEDMKRGKILPMTETIYGYMRSLWLIPVIGSDRKAIMMDACVQFESAGHVPVEADSEGEGALSLLTAQTPPAATQSVVNTGT
ncbi:hypothetical protein F4823DRAFT_588348 [Ustulina deusta]|nr:hypothetical protein F4823DRAFT_588348 [Ustulina deusta]